MRKIEVEITVRLSMSVDEGVEISDVIDELDYEFNDTTTQATIEDTEITDYEVKDSK